jgi:hypothetical protein
MVRERGQMKIMQMLFMIVGVFFFFVLAGLFFLGIMFKDVRGGADELAREQAISSLEILAAMPELSYGDREAMSLDEDKLRVMVEGYGASYGNFWPIASLEVYKIYPAFDSVVPCPAANCNYYNIYTDPRYENLQVGDSGQGNIEKVSSYVSICKRIRELGSVYDRCEVGKIVVGMEEISEVGE